MANRRKQKEAAGNAADNLPSKYFKGKNEYQNL